MLELVAFIMSFKSSHIVIENDIVFDPIVSCEQRDGNLPQRNNNPLNVTYGKHTKQWVEDGKAELSVTKDGRKFLKFCTEKDGWSAGKYLLQVAYADMDPDYAMKRWSNGGYGKLVDKKISEMTDDELDSFMKDIATREGFYSES